MTRMENSLFNFISGKEKVVKKLFAAAAFFLGLSAMFCARQPLPKLGDTHSLTQWVSYPTPEGVEVFVKLDSLSSRETVAFVSIIVRIDTSLWRGLTIGYSSDDCQLFVVPKEVWARKVEFFVWGDRLQEEIESWLGTRNGEYPKAFRLPRFEFDKTPAIMPANE